jgi:biotin synthase
MIHSIAQEVLSSNPITLEEAQYLTKTEDLSALLNYAGQIRKKFCGNRADICTIMNAKSGLCGENCKFCAQSTYYITGVTEYPLADLESVIQTAKQNEKAGVRRFSLVTSGGKLTGRDFEKILHIYTELKKETGLKLCASLGIISLEQAAGLKNAGVTMYHHNIETGKSFFPAICDTHTYDSRISTIRSAMKAGLEICSGGIIGMGETFAQRLEMAFELRDLGVKSVPLNILHPIKGTPLEKALPLSHDEILRTMAVFRFILPDAYLRFAGGRSQLGRDQEKGFQAGMNAALVGNFLTTSGNSIEEDLDMIKRQGFTI